MVDFDPRFEVMPGTQQKPSAIYRAAAYQAVPDRMIAE